MISFRRSRAFSLIEVTMAIGIAAFCLLAIFALLPLGVTTNKNSINNTIAAGLAASIAADLRAVPPSAAAGTKSPLYHLDPATAGTLPDLYLKEDGSIKARNDADYVAKITLTQPKAATVPEATTVYIQICQPAAAANPTVAFEALTAIDRNFP